MKSEVIGSLKESKDKLVDARSKEIEDRKRRESNLVLFNLPEHRTPSGDETKRRDETDFMRLSDSLGLENTQVKICFRLGRKHESQNRPLKIVLANKSHRKYLLDNARTLQEKAPTYMKDVIISKDLTPEQRKEKAGGGKE